MRLILFLDFIVSWYGYGYGLLQNGLATKVEKSRKQMKERKNRAKKIRGVKKVTQSILLKVLLFSEKNWFIAFFLTQANISHPRENITALATNGGKLFLHLRLTSPTRFHLDDPKLILVYCQLFFLFFFFGYFDIQLWWLHQSFQ